MNITCRMTVASLLVAMTSFAAAAEPAQSSSIDKLAQEAYWVKTGPSYKAAMDLLNKPAPALLGKAEALCAVLSPRRNTLCQHWAWTQCGQGPCGERPEAR